MNGSPSETSSQKTEDETESAAGKLERHSKAGKKKGRDVEAGKGETLGQGGTLGTYTHMHLAGSDNKGFMTDWGPVGFKKSRHPLSIMVRCETISSFWHLFYHPRVPLSSSLPLLLPSLPPSTPPLPPSLPPSPSLKGGEPAD